MAGAGRLSLTTLERLPPSIQRPAFDPRTLGVGIVHLGLGNFHRAHQAVFTEDALAKKHGDWGIAGVSLRRPDTRDALRSQDNLYALEILGDERRYRAMGVLRVSLAAPDDSKAILSALASSATHIVTLTITEKGYCLDGRGALDFAHADVRHDIENKSAPRSAIGWLVSGIAARRQAGAQNLTVISCDNLSDNGGKLARATVAFADAIDPSLARWIDDHVRFPATMVDCIVPATDANCRARVDGALGLHDEAPVTREAFAQWVIESRFAGPRPAWESAGAEVVPDVLPFERLKLHVLNAAHSALAYLGVPRGLHFVREAIGDSELAAFIDAMIAEEIASALAPLDVAAYWRGVRARFASHFLDHRLEQIAEDGSVKLAQRIFPLLVDNVRNGRPCARLAEVIRAWLAFARQGPVRDPASSRLAAWAASGAKIEDALDDPALFPDSFRTDETVRRVILTQVVA